MFKQIYKRFQLASVYNIQSFLQKQLQTNKYCKSSYLLNLVHGVLAIDDRVDPSGLDAGHDGTAHLSILRRRGVAEGDAFDRSFRQHQVARVQGDGATAPDNHHASVWNKTQVNYHFEIYNNNQTEEFMTN